MKRQGPDRVFPFPGGDGLRRAASGGAAGLRVARAVLQRDRITHQHRATGGHPHGDHQGPGRDLGTTKQKKPL